MTPAIAKAVRFRNIKGNLSMTPTGISRGVGSGVNGKTLSGWEVSIYSKTTHFKIYVVVQIFFSLV